jgi:nucleoside-diphosphate-sugar epimerase
VPRLCLWLVCAGHDVVSRLSGRPHVLSRQKYAELAAPGWVCSADRLRDETGFVCQTKLEDGVARTLAWYRAQGWL